MKQSKRNNEEETLSLRGVFDEFDGGGWEIDSRRGEAEGIARNDRLFGDGDA